MRKRLISVLCVLTLCLSLLPTAALAAGTDTGKAIQLVDSGTAANIGGGQADNIYFGTYQQSSDGSGGYNTDPIKWRVLENANGQLFLLSDQNLDVFQYHTEYESVTWETSTMRSWLNGYGASENTGGSSGIDYTDDNFIGTAFSAKEQGAIADTTVVNDDNPDWSTEGGNNTTDKIFLLSIAEAQNSSYFADNSSRIATNTAYVAAGGKTNGGMYGVGEADYWWLRSPGLVDSSAAIVKDIGGVNTTGVLVFSDNCAVRPAFNLDLNSVLFTSAAVGGKSSGAAGADALTSVSDYTGNEWKLTLLDESRNFAVTEKTASGKPGDTITLNYAGATTGTNEYISVIIADENGAQYYGRVAQPADTDGKVEITIPSGLADGTYTLYVFSEQYNGGENDDTKLTDYASAFEAVTLTVSSDTTAPTLSSGSATRDSETSATVQFTSDEAGEYYYAVVESGDTAPTIDTTVAGTSCDTTEQTISLTSLSDAGAKDIYIVVKDAAGNVSQQLKITIPAYIAPSYGISASPAALDFGSKTVGYTEAPAAQTVTLTNTGNQNVTVTLPASTDYTITAGEGFTEGTATLAANDGTATFTVQPNTGLAAGTYAETLTVSGGNNVSASIELSFTVLETYTLTVDLNGGSGSTIGGEYAEGAVVNIDAGSRSNYRFDGWTSSNGGSFADASSASTTFTMPAADTTITAAWSYIGGSSGGSTTYAVTASENGNGTVTLSTSRASKGTTVTVTVTPDAGYELGSLTVTDSSGNALELTDKGNGKYTFTMPASWVTVEAVFAEIPPEPLPFADVDESAWYADAVRYVYEHGIMAGYGNNLFGPDNDLSRAQLCQIVYNLEGQPAITGDSAFTDVDDGAWYFDAVTWAASQGIVDGYGSGKFGPEDNITREQLATILYRYAQAKGCDVSVGEDTNLLSYADALEISQYAIPAMQWACGAGILEGNAGHLYPQGDATRAEAAAMLMRFWEPYSK